ncbi:MAG: alpha/beta hydrolase [Asgard group archaeon]|nr:alpha/beta hydrolase [Asgard group archaeon]
MNKYNNLREDVSELYTKLTKWQYRYALKYAFLHPNIKINPMKLDEKVNEEYSYFLKHKKMNSKAKSKFEITAEENLYITKVYRAALEGSMLKLYKNAPHLKTIKKEQFKIGETKAEWQIPFDAIKNQVILYLHGGGYNLGSIKAARGFTSLIANNTKRKILVIDYRLAPEYQYPSALEDSLAVYKWLLVEGYNPEDIIIAGDSAGGGLVLALLLKLKDLEEELPNSAILFSPWTDLTFSGKSFFENIPTDPIIAELNLYRFVKNYLNLKTEKVTNPFVSPLFGEFKGLPPLLFIVSTTEMLYDDAKRIADKAKAAGVEIQWEEWKDMLHVFPQFCYGTEIQESEDEHQKVRGFIIQRLS